MGEHAVYRDAEYETVSHYTQAGRLRWNDDQSSHFLMTPAACKTEFMENPESQ